MKEKVVLAYSGGLDTSVTIPWLKDNYDVDVIAVCVNVGQEDDMDKVKEKAVESGAAKIYVEDVKKEFVTDYLYKAIKWNAKYEGEYLLGTSFARPLIAKKLVEVAHKEGAKYICHGCTGKGNDQVRFETAIAAMDPYIQIIAPWRLWDIDSREAEIDYAKSKGVKVTATKEKIYSEDWNLWHISHEGGDLEDPKNEHKTNMYKCVVPPEKAKDEDTYVSIYFEKGVPTKINGEELDPVQLIEKANKIAGDNGIGIADLVENRLVGMKSRGVYETPGGTLLYEAHNKLEHLTIDKDAYHYKQVLALKYAELVYDGLWFTTTREALDAFVDTVEENVTGTVKLKLYKGNMKAAGVESEYALYDQGISSFGASDLYSHKDAQGFINLFSLPSKIKAMKKVGEKIMKLWGGRFRESESKLMEVFNASLSFDKKLYEEDIAGSIAHVKMLDKCNIINDAECKQILRGLKSIDEDIESGKLKIEGDYEDIHSFVESNLIDRVGEVGKKLHTARSRNDQVAVDMKMYVKKSSFVIIEYIDKLLNTLKDKADKNHFIMPGYTHMQRAQVVTFTHHMMAYYSMFKRDKKRIENAISNLNESPLGCCALAGTTYDTDREFTAKELDFDKPVDNFLDGVSDRDYILEVLSDFSICMMHLSRLSEELIMWSTREFDFVAMNDKFSTGSSIMPQKKNPDAAELIRGKTGRVYGSLIAMLTIMKGLPLAYNKDMQEDKEQFFDAFDTLKMCLAVMEGMISTMKVKQDKMRKAVKSGFLNATDVADYLVTKGIAFRDAHKISGEIVIYCENNEKSIEDLTMDEFKKFSELFDKDIYDAIDYDKVIKKGNKRIM